jgi:deoxyribonuclease V
MKLLVAVQLEGGQARVAAVGFEAWDAAEATKTWFSRVALAEGAAGEAADARKVQGVLQLMAEHRLEAELIVIEGFVHLDAEETPGLGMLLFRALDGKVPVVGVSKKAMPGLSAQFEVAREDEAPPLYVTCAGLDIGAAKARLRAMHGRKRVPTLLKLVARLAKNTE